MFWVIIPYQVITGNYNRSCSNVFIGTDYTIPSDNRELQLKLLNGIKGAYYTIPSDNRELQQKKRVIFSFQIIPYQVITGNYNFCGQITDYECIIPYQVITGNYNFPLVV
ncbi:hypothetical protein ROSINTL182_05401 [Roseburia intestinalis L1-82]|uniref:Uncharacterized protein n=1 Tax=Roseburia intestinalis L1-82 TaxID=536231 RepID=C7G689_9FIRM|nr:hypothetical protein ROSINTL182_05401 [Roseburia intestinalis L1-82]